MSIMMLMLTSVVAAAVVSGVFYFSTRVYELRIKYKRDLISDQKKFLTHFSHECAKAIRSIVSTEDTEGIKKICNELYNRLDSTRLLDGPTMEACVFMIQAVQMYVDWRQKDEEVTLGLFDLVYGEGKTRLFEAEKNLYRRGRKLKPVYFNSEVLLAANSQVEEIREEYNKKNRSNRNQIHFNFSYTPH